MHDFLKDGKLTEDGAKVVAYLNEAVKPALDDRNPNVFNSLAGMVKDYGMNVSIAGFASAESWIAGHPNSAEAVMELVLAKEQQAAVTEAANKGADGVNKLTEQLTALETKLNEALQKIDALEAAKVVVEPSKKADKKADKPAEVKPEAETVEAE